MANELRLLDRQADLKKELAHVNDQLDDIKRERAVKTYIDKVQFYRSKNYTKDTKIHDVEGLTYNTEMSLFKNCYADPIRTIGDLIVADLFRSFPILNHIEKFVDISEEEADILRIVHDIVVKRHINLTNNFDLHTPIFFIKGVSLKAATALRRMDCVYLLDIKTVFGHNINDIYTVKNAGANSIDKLLEVYDKLTIN